MSEMDQGSTSTGSTGSSGGDAAAGSAQDAGSAEVIVGEIPDASDLTHMLWTTRCTFSAHGLLGTFEDKEAAEKVRGEHLLSKHGRRE
jgi:hypothetical protein